MASYTFHPFSRLPVELQLQIWEEACFSPQPNHRGLHYFTLVDGLNYLISYYPTDPPEEPRKQQVICPNNRSACFWDGGLWTACKQSRAVVMKNCEIKELNGPPSRADREREHPEEYAIKWVGRDGAAPPGVITTREGDKERHFIVYPAHDIFCFASQDWEFLERFRREQTISAPSVNDEFDWLDVENMALQFDPSWNLSLPDSIFYLTYEKSARGFLADMLYDVALDRMFACPNMWLIDNNTRWSAEPGQDVIAYDREGEYVEIDWDVGGYYDLCEVAEDRSSAAFFLRELVHLAEEDLREANERTLNPDWSPEGPAHEYSHFRVKSHIRLLVRRDNQVKATEGD